MSQKLVIVDKVAIFRLTGVPYTPPPPPPHPQPLKRQGGSLVQGLSFLHLEIILPFAKLCYAFEGKKFSAIIILGKRSFKVI